MAEKKTTGGRSAEKDDSVQRVIVEMVMPKGEATRAFSMAEGFDALGFQVDTSFEPVPAGEPADPELAMRIEAEGQETVFVRGSVDPKKIKDLEAQDNVIGVWKDSEIAPFGAELQQESEQEYYLESGMGGDNCPISPCDCDHGTAACSKGSMSDVAKYLGVDKIWANGHRGENIVIGIVDGGIAAKGRVAGGTIPNVIGGWPTSDWGKKAAWGRHGNMTSTDALGMAPKANVYDIRISDGNAISNALAGFQWAINQHKANGTPHILSNSWGIYQKSWDPDYATKPNHPFTRKVVEAINQGILVLFAAGNCGEGCKPGSRCGNDFGPDKSIWGANGHPRVMTVGAANIQGRLVGYSSQGPASLSKYKPDFCGISHFTGYFTCDTGTSAACPIAAGVVALMKQCNASLSQDGAKQALKKTAMNIGPAGWDPHSGSGIIQAKAAYDQICKTTSTATCLIYRKKATQYQNLYRRTGNRKYLCYAYRYIAMYYLCLYRQKKNRRYMCLYYRYYAYYYRCLYQVTGKREYIYKFYQYMAAQYKCLYLVTHDLKYKTLYQRYLLLYKKYR